MKKYNIAPTNQTDMEIISHLQNGDENIFTYIYQTYHHILFVFACAYLKDKEMAKDAIQHIFLKLWEARHLISVSSNLKNYLYTMLKNHLLNEMRNQTRAMEKNYQLTQEKGTLDDSLLSKLEIRQLSTILYKGITLLPEQKRRVCLYKIRDGLSNQEIAKKIGISIPTVKTHYTQSIKILRRYLRWIYAVSNTPNHELALLP